MTPRRAAKTDPQILEMPAQKMAVVYGQGAPGKVFATAMPALFGSVYALKFGLKKQGLPSFKVSPARSRYPDAHLVPMDQWTVVIGIPIPEDTTSLPQKAGGPEVLIETWEYGTVAQVLHIGPYDQEVPTVERLRRFAEESGYEIVGVHEEEYLSRPDAATIKTIIRYRVKKR